MNKRKQDGRRRALALRKRNLLYWQSCMLSHESQDEEARHLFGVKIAAAEKDIRRLQSKLGVVA